MEFFKNFFLSFVVKKSVPCRKYFISEVWSLFLSHCFIVQISYNLLLNLIQSFCKWHDNSVILKPSISFYDRHTFLEMRPSQLSITTNFFFIESVLNITDTNTAAIKILYVIYKYVYLVFITRAREIGSLSSIVERHLLNLVLVILTFHTSVSPTLLFSGYRRYSGSGAMSPRPPPKFSLKKVK
jgi:hypothetical protein